MNDLYKFINDDRAFLIFEYLTAEVHLWKVIRNAKNEIVNWKLVYVNPPALKTWQKDSLEEIKGLTTDEIFGDGASEHYLPIVTKIMKENTPFTYQDYFEHLDKHFNFSTIPLGEYFITTGTDITELVKYKEHLKEHNAHLETIVKERTRELEQAVSELKSALEVTDNLRQQMEELANSDALTCLYNRRYFDDALHKELLRNERENSSLSLFMIDIDHFKALNDHEGHAVGDMALKELAEFLRSNTRRYDTLARWGGDEFILLCPSLSIDESIKQAERIRKGFKALKFPWKEELTLSIGIATARDTHIYSANGFMQAADKATYGAKNSGKDRVVHIDNMTEN